MKVEFMKRMDAALKKAREPVAPPCVDKEKECKHWAHIGYCKLIPEFMQEKCKASCNKCPVSRDFKKKYQRFTTEHCNYDCVQHNLKWIKKHTQFSHNLI